MIAYLFIIDPIESLNRIKDSSLLLMKECLRRNIEVHFCEINQLTMNEGNLNVYSRKILGFDKEIDYQNCDTTILMCLVSTAIQEQNTYTNILYC